MSLLRVMLDASEPMMICVILSALTLGCGKANGIHEDGTGPGDETVSSRTSHVGEGTLTLSTSGYDASGTVTESSTGLESSTGVVDTGQDPACPEVMMGRVEFKGADIERFRCLREVDGELVVHNTQLVDLSIFHNLERVTSSFYVSKSIQIQSLRGLENLVEVGGLMWVSNNPLLTDITQLSSIRVSGGLGIQHNESLTDLTSFVGEFPNITGNTFRNLNIGHLIGTEHLTGLESITLFEGRILIHRNPNLVDLQGLTNAMRGVRSRSDLHLVENPVLSSFAGLEHLTEMGTLTMERNPSLVSMEGLGSLQRAEEIWVQESSEFRSVKGLESLEEMGSFIVGGCLADAFVGSPELKTLDGLQGLKHVDHLNLVATGLTTLAGLEGLESVGQLVIAGNRELPWEEVEAFAARFDDENSVLCYNKGQEEACPPCYYGADGAPSEGIFSDESLEGQQPSIRRYMPMESMALLRSPVPSP